MVSGKGEKIDVKNVVVNPEWLRGIIEDFLASSENTLSNELNETAWGRPLVGFAGGDDPVFGECKRHIGNFFWTPVEIFGMSFPAVKAEDLTVISWVLPQTEQAKRDNRKEKSIPSERWARAAKFGEAVNVRLRQRVVGALRAEGFDAIAPTLSPAFGIRRSEKYGYASNWSERHAAYASGLGTFGLCDGLITPLGKAMRCGSVVARIPVPPTGRPYKSHTEYCLFLSQGTCRACITRCPAEAITEAGHDKEKCMAYLKVACAHDRARYGWESNSCGLCQTNVPCESGIPSRG